MEKKVVQARRGGVLRVRILNSQVRTIILENILKIIKSSRKIWGPKIIPNCCNILNVSLEISSYVADFKASKINGEDR